MEASLSSKTAAARILARIALPVFLFSLALAGLLGASRVLVLPRLTRVEVGGSVRQATELQALQASLVERIREEERVRDDLLVPVRDASYDALKSLRRAAPDLALLRGQILGQARAVGPLPGAVELSRFRVVPEEKRAELSGDVRGVGTRSMTVLSQFVAMVGKLPTVASVTQPRYERIQGSSGPHSPFSFSLMLR